MELHTDGFLLVWGLAAIEAQAGGYEAIEPAHLMLGLCKACDLQPAEMRELAAGNTDAVAEEVREVRSAFALASVSPTVLRRRLRNAMGRGPDPHRRQEVMHRSAAGRAVCLEAQRLADAQHERLQPAYLLASLSGQPDVAALLARCETDAGSLHGAALQVLGCGDLPAPAAPAPAVAGGVSPALVTVGGPPASRNLGVLARFGRDLSALAVAGRLKPVFGRRDEIMALGRALVRSEKNDALLIGEPGVGKTAIVEGLAQRLASPDAPDELRGCHVVEISMSALLAGTRYRGEFEERFQALFEEAAADPGLIVFIDEIHTIMGAGGEGASDAANMLKPAISRADIRVIGATTIAEFRRCIESDPALERRFEVIQVDEPSRADTVAILRQLMPRFELHHSLKIGDDAIEAAVELGARYFPERRFPDKAIDLLDNACACLRLQSLTGGQAVDVHPTVATRPIGRREIAEVVSRVKKVAIEQVTEPEARRLMRMGAVLSQRVVGQDAAVQAVCRAVRTARSGLRKPGRPMAVLLFAGLPGTGKTELAKALAEFLFDDPRHLIRFDMSEYMEEHAVARLIGAPPGYTGHGEPGQLVDAVRTMPYSVLLFDEIDKAHPRVLDVFLQVFDDGRLTDGQGRTVSFGETILVMTSNLGSREALDSVRPRSLGFRTRGAEPVNHEAYHAAVMQAIRRDLRPELVSRLDQVLIFDPLDAAALRLVVDKLVREVEQRLAVRRIRLRLDDSVYERLLTEGTSVEQGARQLERAMEHVLVEPLAEQLLLGTLADGHEVWVRLVDGEAKFRAVGPT